jgi:site-specific DNA recombinase
MEGTDKALLRIVIYARLSKNRHGPSTNTAIQVAECESEAAYYAKDHGYRLVIVERFEEDDVSASKYSTKPRPLYGQVLKLVRDNKIDMIWSTETERHACQPGNSRSMSSGVAASFIERPY